MAWRDIEMAPKDGTVVVFHDGSSVYVGHYSTEPTSGWQTEKGASVSPTQWMTMDEYLPPLLSCTFDPSWSAA